MTSKQIDDQFRQWLDPEAATTGLEDVELIGELGGHGHGGKSYMVNMFEDFSYLYTTKNGKGSIYGVRSGTFDFGYSPNPAEGKDFDVPDTLKKIQEALELINVNFDTLPSSVVDCACSAEGFTLTVGVGPKGYKKRRIPVGHFIDSLLTHPQMIRALDLCKIYIIHNNRLFNNGRPLELPQIKPMSGHEKPREIEIPETLTDPETLEEVKTVIDRNAKGKLELHTSERNLQRSREGRRHQHRINYKTSSGGFIGYKTMWSFGVQSPFVDRIYGHCYLDSLETYKTSDRSNLAESPITRAVENWIRVQIENFTKELEESQRRTYEQSEKNEVSKMNEWLDRWKNNFLSELMHGLYGQGTGTPDREREPLPSVNLRTWKLHSLTDKRALEYLLGLYLNFTTLKIKGYVQFPFDG
jgi:hypothetical protein